MANKNTAREPLFHVAKRDNLKTRYKVLIYLIAIIGALAIGSIICTIIAPRGNPIEFFSSLFKGALGSERKIFKFLKDMALLLCVSMALVPAFKMKFWNLGGNGQILMGGLAAITCMWYMGRGTNGAISDTVIIICSVISSMLAGAIWAVIPAIFKALFNTNESLFTLMMNYIANSIVLLMIAIWVQGTGKTTLPEINYGHLPVLFGKKEVLTIVIGVIVTGAMFTYLKYSKQGYELSLVGDSQNTARYTGVKVKKVIIRTLVLSGAVCGLVGLLLTAGDVNPTIGTSTAKNMGFTAIMTTWLGGCNPLFIAGTCALVSFINNGMTEVNTKFGMSSDVYANVVVGIVYFFIIACAFFVQYKLMFRKKKAKPDFINCESNKEVK
jgi:simple sugar transport system permease protein